MQVPPTPKATPTVFLVDDEAPVRNALARVLRSVDLVVFAFSSASEFLAAHDPAAPGCLLLDVAMPGLDGLELQRLMTQNGHSQPIIFLSGSEDVPISVRALKNGALDFLTKPVSDEVLLAAVNAAFEKDRLTRRERAELADIRSRLALLTPREHEVLMLVVAGRLNKQIAGDLGTVEQTIKVHRGRVMAKMRVESLADLVRLVEKKRYLER